MTTSNIMTREEIETMVSKIKGTWVKRRNHRVKLVEASNREITERISAIRGEIRTRKAGGATESDLRGMYASITQLEIKLI